jgi:hypothetical protein
MKAIYAGLAGSVPLNTITNYQYNCNRKPYEIPFHVPVIDGSDIQLYIDFGELKPVSFTSKIISLCDATNVDSPPCQYLFGVTPEGTYYGLFRFAAGVALPAVFAVAIDVTMTGASVRRYFSESYQVELFCLEPMKIEACFPENSNLLGYDTNGIYYGLTTDEVNSSGNLTMRYLHFVNARRAKVFEDGPKLTFSANIRQNFKSVLNRIYELRTELVPNYYKEYLLAVYTRGFIQVSGAIYQVTDLAFEGIDDDDHTWKPYAKLKRETRYYFGCDSQPCNSDCCSPCSLSAIVETIIDPCCSPEPDSVSANAETVTEGLGCGDTYSEVYAGIDQHSHEEQTINIYGGNVSVAWECFDRPNRFTVLRDGVQLVTSGWVGVATYAGPWGASLSTSLSGTLNYTPVGGSDYTVLVEVGGAGPDPISDNFLVTINCV